MRTRASTCRTRGRSAASPSTRACGSSTSTARSRRATSAPGRFVPARHFDAAHGRAELERHLAALRLRVGRPGQRQDRGEVRHRQVRARLQHRLCRSLRSELLQHRDADLERPEPRRHRAGVVRAAASTSDRRLRDRFLDAAGHLRRQAEPGFRRRTSAARIRSRPTSACSARSSPGTSVTFSYFRRDYKNLIWRDNLAIDPSDYTPFTVPNPRSAATRCTLYNLNPAKASAVNILDQNSRRNYSQVHRLRRQLQQPHERS